MHIGNEAKQGGFVSNGLFPYGRRSRWLYSTHQAASLAVLHLERIHITLIDTMIPTPPFHPFVPPIIADRIISRADHQPLQSSWASQPIWWTSEENTPKSIYTRAVTITEREDATVVNVTLRDNPIVINVEDEEDSTTHVITIIGFDENFETNKVMTTQFHYQAERILSRDLRVYRSQLYYSGYGYDHDQHQSNGSSNCESFGAPIFQEQAHQILIKSAHCTRILPAKPKCKLHRGPVA
ncbi:hypothetical protein KEM48_007771 [Puccinia striiformis f. sp. tritici PST-130]|nr:hypothetical protein KEM48_007771 [Puccinia striiformis f. sp. tritici PST-130]